MKIKSVTTDNKSKRVLIRTFTSQEFSLPFSKLTLMPSRENSISKIYVDKELGNEAITYELESGEEDSIHLDVFLDHNKDPGFLRDILLYELTIKAKEALRLSQLTKNEVCRLLKTSSSQLERLLDPTNKSKTIDRMIELLFVLGIQSNISFDDVG